MIKQIKNLPRWAIFTIDVVIILMAYVLANLLRFNFHIPQDELNRIYQAILFVIAIRIFYAFFFKTYAGIIYYTSTEDAQRIFIAATFGTLTFGISNFVYNHFQHVYLVPFSVMIIDWVLLIFSMTAFRLFVKIIYLEISNNKKIKVSCLIYGTSDAAVMIKNMLDRDEEHEYNLIAFVDDRLGNSKFKIEGVNIRSSENLEKIFSEHRIQQLFIADGVQTQKKKKLIDLALQHHTQVLHIPPMNKWINGELSIKQVRQIKIEELLERNPIRLDEAEIKNELNSKTILITGAAGSIGSELARQIMKYEPKKLLLLDQAETPLYELELELLEKFAGKKFETVLADVRNADRMENVIKTFLPEIIFHAAAYKHVPMMEHNPSESILTNVLGSKVVADLATKYGVKKMVLVSTDKAVNPTSVMGASKRIAEIYVQALDKICAEKKSTRFVTTRFGNVLGSNGSVIPLFRKQIADGGPVIVTQPEITRS